MDIEWHYILTVQGKTGRGKTRTYTEMGITTPLGRGYTRETVIDQLLNDVRARQGFPGAVAILFFTMAPNQLPQNTLAATHI